MIVFVLPKLNDDIEEAMIGALKIITKAKKRPFAT